MTEGSLIYSGRQINENAVWFILKDYLDGSLVPIGNKRRACLKFCAGSIWLNNLSCANEQRRFAVGESAVMNLCRVDRQDERTFN